MAATMRKTLLGARVLGFSSDLTLVNWMDPILPLLTPTIRISPQWILGTIYMPRRVLPPHMAVWRARGLAWQTKLPCTVSIPRVMRPIDCVELRVIG